MTLLDTLSLKRPQDYPSKEAYKQDVLSFVKRLGYLGGFDQETLNTENLSAIVLQYLHKEETINDGQEWSKQKILADLNEINQNIHQVNQEISDLEREILIQEVDQEIANLEQDIANQELDQEIADIEQHIVIQELDQEIAELESKIT
ncbi:MAG: hypothetical protein AB4041_03990 [Microcystaceae cyanobacterium]